MPVFRIVEVETLEHEYFVEAATEEEARRLVEEAEVSPDNSSDYDADFEIVKVEKGRMVGEEWVKDEAAGGKKAAKKGA